MVAISHAGAFAGRIAPGASPAFIVIDVVEAYLKPDAPLFLGPSGAGALGVIRRLCDAARRAGAPVIITSLEYDEDGRNGGLFYRKIPALQVFSAGAPLGRLPEGLAAAGDILLVKQYASSFFGTTLASTLTSMGVDTLVISGFSTSGCVRATAVDAIQHGFAPFVVREACADRSAGPHEANLFDIAAKYGEVIGEADAVAIFEKASRRR
jgi:maleamate amidohydrolase